MIKTPISNREMFEFFYDDKNLGKTAMAFEKFSGGSTSRPLKPDGVLKFLKELFPTRIISEGHANSFMAGADKNNNNKITFQEIASLANSRAGNHVDDDRNGRYYGFGSIK